MRLIDADELKIKGYMRLSGYTVTNRLIDEVIDSVPTVQAIPIPDNVTNGDVIKAMFPFGKVWKSDDFMCLLIDGQGDAQMFDIEWWNTPYKGSDTE